MEDKSVSLFRDAPVSRAVITNVVPATISALMTLIYSLADTFFIGQAHNPLMIAAVSVCSPVFLVFTAVGMLFGVGGTSLIARSLGSGQGKKMKNISSFCFWSALGTAVVIMAVLLLIRRPLCLFIGASQDTLTFSLQYLTIITLGLPFNIVSTMFSNIIRSEGKPKIAMTGTVGGNLLNIILDPIFILGLGLGMKGAALATVMGNAFGAIFYVCYISSRHSALTVNPRFWRAGNGIARGVISIGIPSAVSTLLMSVSHMIVNNLMQSYGDLYVAGLGVAARINSIATMLVTGIGTGAQPLFGYCFGARNKTRYMKILRFCLILSFCASLVLALACFIGAKPLVSAFLNDADALGYGVRFARIYVCSAPVAGMLLVFTNAIQGAGAAIPALILSLCRQGLIYLPIVFLLNTVLHSPFALGAAQPATDILTFLLSVVLFLVTYRVYFGRSSSTLQKD